jgi:hypothetical protein
MFTLRLTLHRRYSLKENHRLKLHRFYFFTDIHRLALHRRYRFKITFPSSGNGFHFLNHNMLMFD